MNWNRRLIRNVSLAGVSFTIFLLIVLNLVSAYGLITSALNLSLVGIAAAIIGGLIFVRYLNNLIADREYWHNQIIDAMHQPISVTDMNMNWTNINKPVEGFLGVKRADVIGKQCNNWGAPICNTDKCGIACLRNNKSKTAFDQLGGFFEVDTTYLYNLKGDKVGHIEVVSDVTTKTNLANLVREIQSDMQAVMSGSNQIADASNSLSQGASEQAASLEEITSSMTELGAQTNVNAENAGQADKLSTQAQESAGQGARQMEKMVEAMGAINDSSKEIAKIIKAIDEIAFQTNLLALNAAVEAARAGKHGKGFAVVAQEVRNLAGRSAKAAQQTAELIEGSVKRVEAGAEIVDLTSASLKEIVEISSKVAGIIAEIATASNEQAQGFAQVNQGLSQIERVTQQNTANAEETASSAQLLYQQAQGLQTRLRELESDDSADKEQEKSEPVSVSAPKQIPSL